MTEPESIQVALVSLGCPKNLVDSERMLARLAEGGCVVGAPEDDADVIVVNTCGFLSAAREESLAVVREAIALKEGRCRRVVLAGCLGTRDREKLFALLPGLDAVIGVDNRDEILPAVLGRDRFAALGGRPGAAVSDSGRFRLTPPHTAYLRVSEGCNHGCTFCTIPSIRGPFRSKPVEAVLDEARELIADGAIELNVIGQDTTGYGRDLAEGTSLAGLLRELDELDGVEWIRLLYTYPRGFDEELIDAIASCSKVLPYVDIPLQHIATPVLRRMGRGVTREATIALLERMRERIEGLVLRTTFIVGFPGETEADFQELLAFVRDFGFENLGAFAYSPEEGTPAATFADAVPQEVREQRAEELMQAQQEVAFAQGDEMIDCELDVLVDGFDEEGICVGRWYGQAPDVDGICLLTEPVEPGQIIQATVVAREDYDLVVERP